MVDSRGAADLGSGFSSLTDEERRSLADKAEATGVKPQVTAFLVVLTPDGGAMAHADPAVLATFDARPATIAQIHAACHIITDDILASKAGQVTMQFLQRQAVAAAEQAKNQELLAQVQAGQNGQRR